MKQKKTILSSNLLQERYLDASKPGSFSGLSGFYRALKKEGKPVNMKKLKDWMNTQETYTLHKPVRKKFPRNRIIAQGIDNIWQIDLVDLKSMAALNDSFKYLMTCIDIFSKYAWVIPIKNKTGVEVEKALQKIFDQGRMPDKVHTDEGKEFLNKNVKNLLNKNNVELFVLRSEMKASVVERFNRTLKEKMFRYFTEEDTKRYIDVLQNFVKSYNQSYHRSIKTSPVEVNNQNEEKIRKILYSDNKFTFLDFKFKVGDYVRISKYKGVFSKGYTQNWTREIFEISKRIPRNPPVYRIKDLGNEEIEGIFYESELQKSIFDKDGEFEIEEILKTKKNKKGEPTEYFVRWRGYPEKFNKWIKASDYKVQ
jgi:hypothetical protein